MREFRLYNTITDKVEVFKPISPGEVKMYICGLTVYDYMHIGHARTYIAFDAFIRFLRFLGYKVKYIQNITDIDDKIINRAKERKQDPGELSEHFSKLAFEDMDNLLIERATTYPKATETIGEIISMIELLIKKGYAYEAGGDVYYSVQKFKDYGKLSKQKIDELIAGKRVEPGEHKRFPADFALWKKAKEGEPKWNSSWSKGRPGWHIECSAMSTKYLGETLDIHGGARDLKFPHHENEIAQSEAASGKKFVNYWMHTGFLNVGGEKMAKSLGNFITVRDLLKKHSAEAYRLFILQYHYRSHVDFSYDRIADAEKALERIYTSRGLLASTRTDKSKDPAVLNRIRQYREEFITNLCDDFNTPEALKSFFDSLHVANEYVNSGGRSEEVVKEELAFIGDLSAIFGIMHREAKSLSVERLSKLAGHIVTLLKKDKLDDLAKELEMASGAKDPGNLVDAIVKTRNRLRAEKKFGLSDEIRDRLAEMSVAIDDSSKDSKWRLES